MKIDNVEVYGIIYKITNIINNQVYIGQTKNGFNKRYAFSGAGIDRVYKYHINQKNHNRTYNKHLLNAIVKYGFKSFDVCEIFDKAFSKDELNNKEKYWINYYDSFENGYNNTIGGEGTLGIEGDKAFWYGKQLSDETKSKLKQYRTGKKLSDETKHKIGLANIGLKAGEKHPFYGKRGIEASNYGNHLSEDAKKKIGDANRGKVRTEEWCMNHRDQMKGKNNPMYGISPKDRMDENTYRIWKLKHKNVTDEAKQKISQAHLGKSLSIEHKMKLSQASNNKRKVININKSEIFNSLINASVNYNLKSQNIGQACRETNRSSGGYKWQYLDEFMQQNGYTDILQIPNVIIHNEDQETQLAS